jgi:benzoylformate decarboxylase
MTLQANLTNRDATRMPHPLVKWSFEPPRAADVPHALARAAQLAALPPKGPAFVSIPMDDWGAEVDDDAVAHQTGRTVAGRTAPDPDAIRELGTRLRRAANPVLVAGPDIDASGGWDHAVALADALGLPVWATPAPGGGRIGFPEDHGCFRGVLPPAIGPLAETLAGHDLVLVVGSSVFPYYPNIPGPLLPDGAALVAVTSDPDEAARAPMGDAILADPALALAALLAELGVGEEERADRGIREPVEPAEVTDPLSPAAAIDVLAGVFPANGIVVLESPSSTLALRNRLRLSKPGSYFFGAGGGLGFGLPAAIGVQLARPERPVVCVLGEGSAQYAVQGFWSAAAYKVPVTFLVLRNEEYSILKWFGAMEGVEGAPGLDLPALDTAAVAEGYGVPATRADEPEALREALRAAIPAEGPRLVEARVTAGMSIG